MSKRDSFRPANPETARRVIECLNRQNQSHLAGFTLKLVAVLGAWKLLRYFWIKEAHNSCEHHCISSRTFKLKRASGERTLLENVLASRVDQNTVSELAMVKSKTVNLDGLPLKLQPPKGFEPHVRFASVRNDGTSAVDPAGIIRSTVRTHLGASQSIEDVDERTEI